MKFVHSDHRMIAGFGSYTKAQWFICFVAKDSFDVNNEFVSPRYLDPDMYSMIEDSTNILKSKMFKKLTKSICGLVGILLFNWYL